MSIFTRPPKIAHPDWMPAATQALAKSLRLYHNGAIPSCIQVALLVVPTKYVLRSIYGSDLRAALALLWEALKQIPGKIHGVLWRFWHYRVRMESQERALNEMRSEDDDEEDE